MDSVRNHQRHDQQLFFLVTFYGTKKAKAGKGLKDGLYFMSANINLAIEYFFLQLPTLVYKNHHESLFIAGPTHLVLLYVNLKS